MDITGVKLLLSTVFFVSTLLCLIIPIVLFSCLKTTKKANATRTHFTFLSAQTLTSCITGFGAGIFLGACLLDLLPEVTFHINMTLKHEFQYDNHTSKRYPIAEALVAAGFFLVLFLEQTILALSSTTHRSIAAQSAKKPTIILAHDDDETSFTNDQDPLVTRPSTAEHRFDITEQKDDVVATRNRVAVTRTFILTISLIVHSIFEGIALGSIKESKPFLELFFAIIIHKSIIAFSVGLKLMHLSNKRLVFLACLGLSVATPIGIGIVLSMQELLPNNRTAKLSHDVLGAFACGTFFYITFLDVLPHELNLTSHHRQSTATVSHCYRFLKVFSILLGFSFIALLSFSIK